jgi:hypothetical protein
VRAKDNEPVGNVIAVNNNSIIVTSQGARDEYYISKSYIEKYDVAEVFLNFPIGALDRFKI